MRRASSLVGRSGCLSGNPSSCFSAKLFSLGCQNAGSKKRNVEISPFFPVYGWFTEGFDTRDLKEAKVLLEELAA
jgi:hypothetical protein